MFQFATDTLSRTEIEREIVGRLLAVEGRGVRDLGMTSCMFEDGEARMIWAAIVGLVEDGLAADLHSVVSRCYEADQRVAGAAASALAAVPSGGNLPLWVEMLRERAFSEQRQTVLSDSACKLAAGTDASAVSEHIAQRMAEIENDLGVERQCASVAVAHELLRSIHEGRDSGAIQTGVERIDELCVGLLPGDYVIIAARPSVGKSAFAMNICMNMARRGIRSAFFSLEMSTRSVIGRILASASGIGTKHALRNPAGVDVATRANIVASGAEVLGLLKMIEIRDDPVLDIDQLAPIARDCVKRGARVIVCDYLQLMRGEGRNREQQVEGLSRDWKRLCKQLRVPGIMLAQLNRASAQENRAPRLDDLRNSGAIEQDADIVWLLHRPNQTAGSGEVQVMQAKGRDVGVGVATLFFNGQTQRFGEIERRPEW